MVLLLFGVEAIILAPGEDTLTTGALTEFERVQEILKSPKEALSNGKERSTHAKKLYDRIESGERKPSAALFGYRISSSKFLEIDEPAAESVRMIFDLAMQDYSVTSHV